MLSNKISQAVLTLSCSLNGQGGIGSVVSAYQSLFSPFQHVTTQREGGIIIKLITLGTALSGLIYYRFFRHVRIVHIHSACHNSYRRKILLMRVASFLKYKIIFHLHGGAFENFSQEYGRKKIRLQLEHCDRVIVLSSFWKNFLETSIGLQNVTIINNIIPSPPENFTYRNNRKIHVLFLGALNHQKGIFDLLNVLAEYKNYFEEKLELHVGGNGEVKRFQDFVKKHELTEMITFYGWVKDEQKKMLLSTSDIFILPSYAEGVPISILEAMSYGMPIISTNVGGIPSIVEDEWNGFLFTPGDLDTLYSILVKLSASVELRQKMGKRSYEKSLPYYPANVEKQLSDMYNELLM